MFVNKSTWNPLGSLNQAIYNMHLSHSNYKIVKTRVRKDMNKLWGTIIYSNYMEQIMNGT
jgi:hypothetical protein